MGVSRNLASCAPVPQGCHPAAPPPAHTTLKTSCFDLSFGLLILYIVTQLTALLRLGIGVHAACAEPRHGSELLSAQTL